MLGQWPGNCRACVKRCQVRASATGERAKTPCDRCPKFKLYDDWHAQPGLHPANELAVELYYKAQGDERVGTMAGAFLLRTLNKSDIQVVLDEHDHLFPTFLHRQNAFEKMIIIDRVATEVRGEQEEQVRADAEANAKNNKR